MIYNVTKSRTRKSLKESFSSIREASDAFNSLGETINDFDQMSHDIRFALSDELKGSFQYDIEDIIKFLQRLVSFNNEIEQVEKRFRRNQNYVERLLKFTKRRGEVGQEYLDDIEDVAREIEQRFSQIENDYSDILRFYAN